jgi:predicted metalloprotease with PDZ domain
MASYDAWIKYYRNDENTPNTAISYYIKGAVIGFLLDTTIRRVTNGGRSLDDVMRLMLERFSGEKGYTNEDVRAVVLEVAGPAHAQEVRSWLQRALETTSELDYAPALDWFGLRLQPPAAPPRAWLGVSTRVDDQRAVVTGIRRGSPAAIGGLSLLDEIVAIDGVPLRAGQLAQRVAQFSPGTKVTFSVERSGTMRTVEIVLGADPAAGWDLTIAPGASRAQSQHLEGWLNPRTSTFQ